MAQAGYTPIQLYFSTMASAAPSAGNLANGELALNITDGKLFYKDNGGVVQVLATKAGASGDVVGPGSSTDNALVRFDSTTGKLVQNSVGILDDSGNLTGLAAVTATSFAGALNGTVGASTPNTGAFTTLSASGAVTLSGGTANGVAYLNGSKVLTTGSALTFDGTNFYTTGKAFIGGTADGGEKVQIESTAGAQLALRYAAGTTWSLQTNSGGGLQWNYNGSEQMRLTSTGLGIGTSSPASRLEVYDSAYNGIYVSRDNTGVGGGTFFSFREKNSGGTMRAQNFWSSYWATATAGSEQSILSLNQYVAGANTEVLRVQNGNLGIGTSSPSAKLQIASGGSIRLNRTDNANTGYCDITYAGAGVGLAFNDRNSEGFQYQFNGTAQLTLNSSGNLGLGVTPSAWNAAPGKVLQINSAHYFGDTGQAIVTQNAYYNSQWLYQNTAQASNYTQVAGTHRWYTAPSGTAGNAISFTQAMTLDASGNLLVGTTSSDGSRLRVYGAYQTFGDGAYEGLIGKASSLVSGGGSGDFAVRSAANLVFATNGNTERARIDSSGNLLVGTQSNLINPTGNGFVFLPAYDGYSVQTIAHINGTGGGAGFLNFTLNGSSIGAITQNGTTGVFYGTSSDYRLKEDIQPMTGALAKVAALKPCTYKWKADGSDGEGFIAHELAEVVPQAVTGEKDAVDAEGKPVYQGIDTSFLVATLTAAIQELKAEFDAVKAELAALKGTA